MLELRRVAILKAVTRHLRPKTDVDGSLELSSMAALNPNL
jgi:hypothetical protein